MVVLEKKTGDILSRTIVDNGKIYSQRFINDIMFSEVDISMMYRLFFGSNFNNAYSRNPDLNVAKYLEHMDYGVIVNDSSKFMPPDVMEIE